MTGYDIIDYGESFIADNGKAWRAYHFGIAEYMAPEVNSYGLGVIYKYSVASDWYALGKIINLVTHNFEDLLSKEIEIYLKTIGSQLTDIDPAKRSHHIDQHILKLNALHLGLKPDSLTRDLEPTQGTTDKLSM